VLLFDMGKLSAIVESIEEDKIICKFRCDGNISDNSIIYM